MLVVPRFGERLLTPQADVLVDVLFVVGALLLALWLARPAGLAPRRGRRAPRRRDADEARGPALRGGRARGRARRVAGAEAPGAAGSLLGVARRASPRPSPGASGTGAHDDRRRGAADVGVGGSFDRVVDALRLSFDVLFDSGLWSVVPVVAIVALAAAAVWGDRRLAAYFGALLALVFVGGAWVDVLVRRHPDHGRTSP